MKQLHVIIQGQVQGVFFRLRTKQLAQELNLTGWIRNNSDGTVEAIFQGEEQALNEIIKFCKTGPSAANVTNIKKTFEEMKEKYDEFTINN